MSEWQKVGQAGVDSGLIWIGDPCYVVSKDASHVFPSWKKFCNMLDKGDNSQVKQWDTNLGVSVQSGVGDGLYDVFVKRDREGNIAEAKIVFIDESAEEFEDNEGC